MPFVRRSLVEGLLVSRAVGKFVENSVFDLSAKDPKESSCGGAFCA
jgi:hypothetical protein